MVKKDAINATVEITKAAIAGSNQNEIADPDGVVKFIDAVYNKLVELDNAQNDGSVKVV